MNPTVSPGIVKKINGSDIVAEWQTANDQLMAKEISNILDQQYPGYTWMVHVNQRGGLIDICCMHLSCEYTYSIKLKGLFSWDNLRDSVKKAGGELLERFNQPRTGFDDDQYKGLELDFRGIPKGDTSK